METTTPKEQYLKLVVDKVFKIMHENNIPIPVGFSLGNPTSILEIMSIMDQFRKLGIGLLINQRTPNSNDISNVLIIPEFDIDPTTPKKESFIRLLELFVNNKIHAEYFDFLDMFAIYREDFKVIRELLKFNSLNDKDLIDSLILWKLSSE